VLLGTGPAIAALVACAVEKAGARTAERFGRGAIEGGAAPEAAAAARAEFLPALPLDVPGDTVIAILLGAAILHGIQTGPQFAIERPEVFRGPVASLRGGDPVLLGPRPAIDRPPGAAPSGAVPTDLPGDPPVRVPGGAERAQRTSGRRLDADARRSRLPLPPKGLRTRTPLSGFVLGPLLEVRSRSVSPLARGDPTVFARRPAAAAVLAIALLGLGAALAIRARRRRRQGANPPGSRPRPRLCRVRPPARVEAERGRRSVVEPGVRAADRGCERPSAGPATADAPPDPAFAPESPHRLLLEAAAPKLAFDPARPLAPQRAALRDKLLELLAIPEVEPGPVRVARERRADGLLERRFVVTPEPGAAMPCHLVLPEHRPPEALVLCLQGHTSGMHISLGRAKDARDVELVAGGRDYARQATARGLAALAVELRGFGERRDRRPPWLRDRSAERDPLDPNATCRHAAMVALLLGRTSLGEKILDLRAALAALRGFPETRDLPVWALGNSGGGTLAWYLASVEPSIAGLVLGSCFATFASSLGAIDHCCDNYLPGALRWFDFPDLALLVAPRPLVVVQGEDDPLFPAEGVRAAFARARAIYAAAGALDRCRLVLCPGGHRFYPEEAWTAFAELFDRRAAA
jgi:dienelactone hydrolase